MRKIIVLTFLTLDGVMQAPGGKGEDPSNGFKYEGWSVPFFDAFLGVGMGKQMGEPFDLLLGRKTYEIFKSYWPDHKEEGEGINNATKYVLSHDDHSDYDWEKTVVLHSVEDIKKLKAEDGKDLQVHGSSELIQILMKEELVDEFWLKIFPVTLGKGKRLFGEGTIPASFKLIESSVSPSGVIIASYKRDGDVKTGSF